MTQDDRIEARIFAQHIADNSNAAFWVEGIDDHRAAYLEDQARDYFHQLPAMGYTVTLIAAVDLAPTLEAAE